MAILHNRISKEVLRQRLSEEPFKRVTISFYRYVIIEDAAAFRDQLYKSWNELDCFGRIYVAREGINAQMSVPQHNLDVFLENMDHYEALRDMPIKYAVEDDGKSFYKLTIKARERILADGLDDNAYDVTNVGKHLSALEFHKLSADPDTLVIDMRNRYESEIGHFENAFCPDVDTFRDEIRLVVEKFSDQKDRKVLLYCTGGIRCEKASAYLKHNGFSDVNQLHGGVIEYARQIKRYGIPSRFIGKNFVFDERMGERIDDRIISHCHQCGAPCDTHVNCANDACHLLFIQCTDCAANNSGCCSDDCKSFIALPVEEQRQQRKSMVFNGTHNSHRGLRLESACQL
ncbi:MAG: rhodanese-related sulfurtransferase [bacterium]